MTIRNNGSLGFAALGALAAVAVTALSTRAEVMGVIYSDAADGFLEVRDSGGPWPQVHPDTNGGFSANIGEWFGPGLTTTVLPFQLPDFGAKDDPFLSANLGVHVFQKGNATVSGVDLYGVRIDADPSIKIEDNYSGAAIDATPGVVLIQEDFLNPSGPVDNAAEPNNFTDAPGDVALLDFLNASYDGGANAGSFVFLRLSYAADGFATQWDAYTITTSQAQFEGDWPRLSYTAVPEPTSAAIGLLAIVVLFGTRARS